MTSLEILLKVNPFLDKTQMGYSTGDFEWVKVLMGR